MDKWIEEAMPALESYAQSSTKSITAAIQSAREKRLDDVDTFLAKRFTKSQASAIKAIHLNEEDRPIETLWDAATGITAYARGIQYQEDRVALERKAGDILDLAA